MYFNLQASYFFGLLLFVVQTKKKKTQIQASITKKQTIFQHLFLITTLIALIGILIYFVYQRNQFMRAQKLKYIKKALQVKQIVRKDRPCTLTQMQKEEAIAQFSKRKWILQEAEGNKITTISLSLIDVKRKPQIVDGSKCLKQYYDAFYVDMKAESSKLYGVIMFEKHYPTIIFEKSNSNSKNQNGTYDYKFYEGALSKGKFQGKWYLTNDTKINLQRQALTEKQISSPKELPPEKIFSLSKKQMDQSNSLKSSKIQTGLFKLYYSD